MEASSLDDFMTLNDQIAALAEARVPTGLGLRSTGDDVAKTLERVNAAVARRVSRGEELTSAIGDDDAASVSYRGVMQTGWRSGAVQRALESAGRLAEANEESRYRNLAALLYPLLVFTLASVGIIGFCLWGAPAMAGIYQEFRLPESATLRVLERLPAIVPYLVAAALLALLLVWLVKITSGRGRSLASGSAFRWWNRINGSSRAEFDERCVSFCEQLILLVEAGVPLDEGAALAAEACGDPTLQEGARAAFSASSQRAPIGKDRTPSSLPPFLRWALADASATMPPADALRLASRVYQEAASCRSERARLLTPMAAGVVIGGGAVLAYGLALFLPITEMLQALAR